MLTLTLKNFAVHYWGFAYDRKGRPFKGLLFATDEGARSWLGMQGRAIEVASDTYNFCDCHTCDHCLGNPMNSRMVRNG